RGIADAGGDVRPVHRYPRREPARAVDVELHVRIQDRFGPLDPQRIEDADHEAAQVDERHPEQRIGRQRTGFRGGKHAANVSPFARPSDGMRVRYWGTWPDG